MATATATMTAPAAVAGPSSERQRHVPLACFGNGRRTERTRNDKMPRKQPDIFVPSKALEEFIGKMPQVSQPRWSAALIQLGGSLSLLALSVLLLAYSPWFFLPVAWIIAGSALSLFFIIGHDCAHDNWTPSPLVNTLVGELSFLLLLQPFESFKLGHNFEHADEVMEAPAKDASVAPANTAAANHKHKASKKAAPPTNAYGQSVTIEPASNENTEPLPWWLLQLFDFISANYAPQSVPLVRKARVQISIALSVLFDAAVLVALLTMANGGPLAVVRFWAMPLLAYRILYSGICRLWTLNVRAFLPKDNPHSFSIASYNYALLTKMLATSSQYGSIIRSSSLVSLFKSWIPRINWVNTTIIVSVPLISMIGMFTTELQRPTLYWSLAYYMFTGIGITAGYHRLWAHKSYDANFITRFVLMLAGSGALQGSIKWWCGGHRVHHRFTDTPKDPYNSHGGFWYAHVGWMLIKPDPANHAKSDIRDLNADPIIRFQHTYYLFVGPFMAFVFPTLVAGLGWGDWMGGYFYAGAFRLFFVHHSTFCVNSVAHYFGEHTFDDDRTPRDHVVTALLTFGEGYHNFHHEFPNDYRNGIQWYHYDPTKWVIAALGAIGFTTNLRVFPKNEIRRGVVYMREKKLAALRAQVVAPKERGELPEWSWERYVTEVKVDGKTLIAIGGFVHDATPFLQNHPGGAALLHSYAGKDATEVFHGRTTPCVYKHSHAAHNLLSNMRVATIDPATVPDKKQS